MPEPLFNSTLVDLPTFPETWAQVTSEPGKQTETLLSWLSWGTYRLNTPGDARRLHFCTMCGTVLHRTGGRNDQLEIWSSRE